MEAIFRGLTQLEAVRPND